MRRATNNKRGRWVEVVLKSDDNKTILAGTFYAYEQRKGTSKYYVVFTKGGEHFSTYYTVLAAVPIKPPKWAGNMWDVSDEAERVNHFVQLYDARYKTIISDTYEGKAQADVRDYTRKINFLNKLKGLEPWK